MVFCTYCGRSFKRTEHLQRHVLTHTKVRPFKCPICHLSFTRRDLVRKHYRSHAQLEVDAHQSAIAESLQGDQQPPGGQRVGAACVACAKTKTKCDDQNPCSRCRSKGLTCVPRTQRRAALHATQGAMETSLPDAQEESGQNLNIGALEVTTQPASATEARPTSQFNIPLSPFSEQNQQETGEQREEDTRQAANGEADHDPPTRPIPPNLASQDAVSTYDRESSGRDPTIPLLPHLSWESLGSDLGSSHYQNSPHIPHRVGANSFENSDWHVMNISSPDIGDISNQNLAGNGGLFSFNMEESAWQARVSALDSIMAQCFQPVAPTTPMGPTAFPEADLENAPDGMNLRDLNSPAHNDNPQEEQTPSDIVMAEEELDRWALGQCTMTIDPKQSYSSPTQSDNSLDQGLQDYTSWSAAVERYRDHCFEPHERIKNVDLTEETREWMLVAVQHFLRTGMDSCDVQALSSLLGSTSGEIDQSADRFLLLPPSTSLQKWLDIFLTSFEPFSPMIPALSLDPNKLASRSSGREATLLLFLMIAFGAMVDPAPKARQFSHTLTEVCRHSLRKAIDGGVVTTRDTLTLQCALIFTVQTSFSGRKSHMEIGTAQRHMYLAMMRNAGYFRNDFGHNSCHFDCEEHLDACWKAWIEREIVSRLCYSWVIADQEISLFYDTPPVLMLTELDVSLPAHESLWMAPDSRIWKEALDRTQGNENEEPHLSLHELFALFVEDRLHDLGRKLGPMDLRLLLHPLHSVVANYRQVTASLYASSKRYQNSASRVRSTSSQIFEEIHNLTRRWLAVFEDLDIQGARLAAVARATLIQYHLISINLLAPFKVLESFTRKENPNSVKELAAIIQEELTPDYPELLLHCGQVLRLVRGIDVKLRPIWWSIAVYRATIVLWAYSITRRLQMGRDSPTSKPLVPLDTLPFFDPNLSHYLIYRAGNPHLTANDGTIVPMGDPRAVLRTCMEPLDRHGLRMTRLTKGLHYKLEASSRNWESIHQQLEM